MKKIFSVLIVFTVLIGAVSAQDFRIRYLDRHFNEITILNGIVRYINGTVAVDSPNGLYYVPELEHFIGFFDGLREFGRISLTGYVWRNYVIPVTINLNGRNYDMFPRYYERVRAHPRFRDCPYWQSRYYWDYWRGRRY